MSPCYPILPDSLSSLLLSSEKYSCIPSLGKKKATTVTVEASTVKVNIQCFFCNRVNNLVLF